MCRLVIKVIGDLIILLPNLQIYNPENAGNALVTPLVFPWTAPIAYHQVTRVIIGWYHKKTFWIVILNLPTGRADYGKPSIPKPCIELSRAIDDDNSLKEKQGTVFQVHNVFNLQGKLDAD